MLSTKPGRAARAVAAGLSLAAALIPAAALARREDPAAAATPPAADPGGVRTFDLASTATGRTYRVSISVPPGPAPAKGFPALVLLDGNFTFPIAWAQSRLNLAGGDGGRYVIVGVGYPTDDLGRLAGLRTRDLTPSPPAADLPMPVGAPPPDPRDYGGADPFFDFLSGELMPRVQSQVPIDGARMALFGHSLGGLFALRVLLRHPEAFQTYLISSPYLAFDHGAVIHDWDGFVPRLGAARPRILLSVGGEEGRPAAGPLPPGMTPEIEARLLAELRPIARVRDLHERLAGLAKQGLVTESLVVFPEERHSTVVAAAIGRGLVYAERPPD